MFSDYPPIVTRKTRTEKLRDRQHLMWLMRVYSAEMDVLRVKLGVTVYTEEGIAKRERQLKRLEYLRDYCRPFVAGLINA